MPSEPTPLEVRTALRRVRSFYELGCKSLKSKPGRMEYGSMKEEASRFGLSEELLRKARQFADPDHGYTLQELNAILSQCRDLVVEGNKVGFALGTTHVIRWLSVPNRRRARIERLTIAERWTLSRLESEIAKEFGSRRAGGRRRKIPANSLDALVQLEAICNEWRRWYESLHRDLSAEGKRKTKTTEKAKITPSDLPEPVRKLLPIVTKTFAELQAMVSEEIRKAKPSRLSRET